ncbi:MAG: hypothetical protein BGO30_05620 [Bacteroidetes bacterium 41-46]|nr:MAG: hypothetical protein BGO30_05620 [Bacteroidetes bacterium 41-46]
MKRQITVFILFLAFVLPLTANNPKNSEVLASNNVVVHETASSPQKRGDGPDWTYYIWISAAFILVALVGFAENLINEEREKAKKLRAQNQKQLNQEYNE